MPAISMQTGQLVAPNANTGLHQQRPLLPGVLVKPRPGTAANLPITIIRRSSRSRSRSRSRRSRGVVRVSALDPSFGSAIPSPSFGLLGGLVLLAANGAVTAAKDLMDEKREKDLVARAKARHQQFLQESGQEGSEGDADVADAAPVAALAFANEGTDRSIPEAPAQPTAAAATAAAPAAEAATTSAAPEPSAGALRAMKTDEAVTSTKPLAASTAPPEAAPEGSGSTASDDAPLAAAAAAEGRSDAVTVYYQSGWPSATLHGSVAGGEWTGHKSSSQEPAGWHKITVDTSSTAAPEGVPLLEFVMTRDYEDWDKPLDGSNYAAPEPGQYALCNGAVRKLSDAPPFMVVSDLDGTMVGDDKRTAAFKAFWESGPRLQGCKLVYSSGSMACLLTRGALLDELRQLNLFLELREQKAGVLAEPDLLVLGVGTEIYSRGADGGFEKDATWSELLDNDWDLQAVREAAYAALAEVGKDSMHFRPPEEQNDHKITCGVRTEAVERVKAILEERIGAAGLRANIISSGQGEWRYLDLVSLRAGKRESLEYAASAAGFPLDRTVACGDSGNDTLMLAGQNKAIVVGNAQDDLRRWVETVPGDVEEGPGGAPSRLRVTEASEAEGILEGLKYFGFRE